MHSAPAARDGGRRGVENLELGGWTEPSQTPDTLSGGGYGACKRVIGWCGRRSGRRGGRRSGRRSGRRRGRASEALEAKVTVGQTPFRHAGGPRSSLAQARPAFHLQRRLQSCTGPAAGSSLVDLA